MRSLRREAKQEHIDTEGSWAISYADMITLLVSFFVLFFTVDHKKTQTQQMHTSLKIRLIESGITDGRHPTAASELHVGDTPGEGIDPKIMQKFGATIHEIGDQLVIEFKEISFFPLGQVDVTGDGRQALEGFATSFVPYAGRYDLAIRAFTDSRPVKSKTGRFKDNLELSALRSVAAMRVLQTAGVPLRDMRIAGSGEYLMPFELIANGGQKSVSENQEQTQIDPLRFARKVVLVIEPKRAERI